MRLNLRGFGRATGQLQQGLFDLGIARQSAEYTVFFLGQWAPAQQQKMGAKGLGQPDGDLGGHAACAAANHHNISRLQHL